MEVCRHLRHFLRGDKPILATDQLSAVTDRLEHLMLTAPTALRGNMHTKYIQTSYVTLARHRLPSFLRTFYVSKIDSILKRSP